MDSAIVRADISQVLTRIKTMTASGGIAPDKVLQQAPAGRFSGVLEAARNSLQSVNAAQNQMETVKNAWLSGEPNTSISQVMLASVKSRVAFEGLLVVRNKLLESYREIMNMPV
ncbi:flagellar hook-basal body complex protein [Legionella geestiana]|uniref:Flagellar hook-basal body complex protein FliE n=1 Tax=Legionella geestiana TaxID=45065 RepID=A0A0W0TWM7_9GAMM|nr:flagellar hook-basal body complex protein FliE [Legionella geestiana]KTD00116.1 flagellar hook-basal body complex protein [Legionella geestiana]QBS11838.1 flagellar hook-basal body complex protein FliE [Legionella geestiana]QDQ40547.1 flagellar hook-basal body complex protein FliE [Legionella geestiana]STX53467.1 flagellar hook-basal body complex protein FliE [Legionella geestiana]